VTFGLTEFYKQFSDVRAAIDTPEQREEILTKARQKSSTPKQQAHLDSLENALAEKNLAATLESLDLMIAQEEAFRQKMNDRLNPVERIALQAFEASTKSIPTTDQITRLLSSEEIESKSGLQIRVNGRLLNRADSRIQELDAGLMYAFVPLAIIILIWPFVIWPVFAFAFRGGIAYMLSGMSIVRKSGRRAARWRIALRCLLAWLPFSLVLLICLYVQLKWPEAVAVRTGLLIVALLMLPMMLVLAVRNPTRGPHDKLLGTYLVPN
jgi:hypothetical protein